jgi:hypothetical protein
MCPAEHVHAFLILKKATGTQASKTIGTQILNAENGKASHGVK